LQKNNSSRKNAIGRKMSNKVAGFLNEIKIEMTKVSWPTRNELMGSTIVVLVSLAMLAAFIGVCDLFLSKLVNVIMSRL